MILTKNTLTKKIGTNRHKNHNKFFDSERRACNAFTISLRVSIHTFTHFVSHKMHLHEMHVYALRVMNMHLHEVHCMRERVVMHLHEMYAYDFMRVL